MNSQSNENGNRLFVGSRFVFRIEKEGGHHVKTAKAFSFSIMFHTGKATKGYK